MSKIEAWVMDKIDQVVWWVDDLEDETLTYVAWGIVAVILLVGLVMVW